MSYAKMLNRLAFGIGLITLALHTWAIGSRMYLQDRPPITNLYSTGICIGWLAVVLGLILENLFRNGFGNVVGAFVGSITVLIAHFLSTDGDTMEMMRAVLDTNLWLSTHVVVVNAGYSATFVVGALGILFIVLGIVQYFTRCLSRDVFTTINLMMYGILCFATLCSFVGTVLGGIWADQSWGRFWGWDPKENGALMIVIMNALILHARWGGIVQQRGIAVLSLFGNIITAWSYFGVNMLGVGLHAYGFIPAAVWWLAVFMVANLVLAFVGAMPFMNCWKTAGVQKVSLPPPDSPVFKKRR
jgi:ABC-type transport system involved in cytochrome c biogenesis permease subunit